MNTVDKVKEIPPEFVADRIKRLEARVAELVADRDDWKGHAELNVEVGLEWQLKHTDLETEFHQLVRYVQLTDFIVDGHSFEELEDADEVRKAYQALSPETQRRIEDAE